MAESTIYERVTFYTRARRFPQLIGKIGDWRLFGGPYTLTQFITMIAGVWLLMWTAPIWARSSNLFMNGLVALLLLIVSVKLAGLLPSLKFSPGLIILGLLRVYTAPAVGTYRGQKVRVRRPHKLRTRVSLPLAELDLPVMPRPAAPEPQRAPPDRLPTPVSSVSALLARAVTVTEEARP